MFVAIAKDAIAPQDSTNGTVLEQHEITNIRIGDRVKLKIPAAAKAPEHNGLKGWLTRELADPQYMDVLIDGLGKQCLTVTCDRTWLSLVEVSQLHIGDVVTFDLQTPKSLMLGGL